MVGMFVIGGIVVFGIIVLTFFRIKWNKADKALFRARADRLEKERIETAAKA